LVLLIGCTSVKQDKAVKPFYEDVSVSLPVKFESSGVNGWLVSNQKVCRFSDGTVPLMVFGKNDNSYTDEAVLRLVNSVDSVKVFRLETWTNNVPDNRRDLYVYFNPTKSYPTLILGCKFMKVGVKGSMDDDVKNIKTLLSSLE